MNKRFGSEWGPKMLQMYWHLDRTMSALEPSDGGGMLFEIWLLGERWLTRPLVPLPELLTDAEKQHYRRHQFQALTEAEADNPLEAQGVQAISGVASGRHFAHGVFEVVESEVHGAIAALQGDLPPELVKFRKRLEVLVCFVRTCDNFIRFTTLAEHVRQRITRDERGNIIPPKEDNWGNQGDQENRSTLYNYMRAELDNTQNLIDLIENAEEPLLVMGERPDLEDIFVLSPKLVDQLRRKRQIMLDHWLDMNLILRRPNL
jgi:hypothetical protein